MHDETGTPRGTARAGIVDGLDRKRVQRDLRRLTIAGRFYFFFVILREILPSRRNQERSSDVKRPIASPLSPVFCTMLLVLNMHWTASAQVDEREKNPLPRSLTPEEEALLPAYVPPRTGPSIPPPREVRAMAEFEELEGIVVRWAYGTSDFLLSKIVDAAQDEGTVWVLVRPGTSDSTNIKNYLTGLGIPLTNIQFLSAPTNSIWSRDYGPWTVYDTSTDSMAFVDFRYNRPRPLDDVIPSFLASQWGLPLYQTTEMPDSLVFTGGNFMVDGFGTGFASRLVEDENTHLNGLQIDSIMWRYCGLERFVKMQTLLYDAIHHIDMHMKLLDEETLLIGQYPPGQGDYERIENTVEYLRTLRNAYGRPYRIVRIPMPPDNSGRYPPASYYLTYTNSLIVNTTVLVPVYGLPQDAAALQVYRDAMPGYRVLGFDCNAIIPANGAIHCITKEVGVREPILIAHERLVDIPDSLESYRVDARITTRSSIDSVLLFWRPDTGQVWTRVVLADSNGTYAGTIPRQRPGTRIGYFLSVKTPSGRIRTKPPVGADGPFTFAVQSWTPTISLPITNTDGWNLISCPVDPMNDSVQVLFPAALTSAFSYEDGSGYQMQQRMSSGTGYWLKFDGPGSTMVTGLARFEDSVEVVQGWNFIGSISVPVPVADITTLPDGIIASGFYGYNGTYAPADTVLPGHAYWVRSSQQGQLIFSAHGRRGGANGRK